jgi:Ca2+-binding EF-hand superfamily protein
MRALFIGSFLGLVAVPALAAAMPEPQPLAATVSAIFAAADVDHDGVVDRKELEAAIAGFRDQVRPGFEHDWSIMLRVAGADPEADGIDFPAAARGTLALYGLADTNHDDVVTPEETRAFLATMSGDEREAAAEFMTTADADADGKVDAAELASLRTDVESYLAAQARDPDQVPEGGVVSKSATLQGFVERADAVRNDAMARFDRIAGAGTSAKLAVLEIDVGRVAEALPPAGER